jgi:hypothetical protein
MYDEMQWLVLKIAAALMAAAFTLVTVLVN